MPRNDGRAPTELRPLKITLDAFGFAEGVALIEMGKTRVLCAASVEESVPPWLRGRQQGWVTGEYALLPRSTTTRTRRERNGASGRTQEIQRLHRLCERGALSHSPLVTLVAAISAGYVGGAALLDLDYSEDSVADLGCNVVQTGDGGIVEVQCTAEGRPISRGELDGLLDLVSGGIQSLLDVQRDVLARAGVHVL